MKENSVIGVQVHSSLGISTATFVTGRQLTPQTVFTNTPRTRPSCPRYTSTIRQRGHSVRTIPCSFRITTSPIATFLVGNLHLCLLRIHRYSLDNRSVLEERYSPVGDQVVRSVAFWSRSVLELRRRCHYHQVSWLVWEGNCFNLHEYCCEFLKGKLHWGYNSFQMRFDTLDIRLLDAAEVGRPL